MSPRKVRRLSRVLVGSPAREARAQLTWQKGKAAGVVGKLLDSAVANARNNFELEENNLRVADIKVNEGMRFKRWRPRSRGMAHPYVKRTSHITVVLSELGTDDTAERRSGKRPDIQTLSVDELADRGGVGGEEKKAPAGGKLSPPKKISAFQKVKMGQQGGNKKKTHRRKSV